MDEQSNLIKLFVVDDSAIVRTTIASLVEKESDIKLVGTAVDPIFAMEKFEKQGWPDVIILDIEMPRMDGLTFLKQIMSTRPTPVIICSAFALEGSSVAIEAMSLGAIEILCKPKLQVANYFEEVYEKFVGAIRAAAKSKLTNLPKSASFSHAVLEKKLDTDTVLPRLNKPCTNIAGENFIAIGASTGGVQTLEFILKQLPPTVAPIVVVQHMPAGFTASFANRLDTICEVSVKEAKNGEKLFRGNVYIAPGELHTTIQRVGNSYQLEVKDGPRVSRHKPSVDVLFRSCANEGAKNCTAFILTGMGDDGAKGMKEIYDKGGKTYAQDEKSSIVYGMPKSAVEAGGVMKSLTLLEIAEAIKAITARWWPTTPSLPTRAHSLLKHSI